VSVVVHDHDALAAACHEVVAALPKDPAGRPLGVAFIQPFLEGDQAGVAFFDGFFFERTLAHGDNQALTGGQARGDVMRGHLERDEPWSDWLRDIDRAFKALRQRAGAIDIEFTRDAEGWILLQLRAARFTLRRNRLLSLANHKEILGDLPSPWIVSVLRDAGQRVLEFFAEVDPDIRRWDGVYAVVEAERAWMNFSFFFRLMDHWGLPRSFVTEGVGGHLDRAVDQQPNLKRIIRMSPRLIHLQLKNVWTLSRVRNNLRRFDQVLDAADDLPALYHASVAAMTLAIRTNFAINGMLTGLSRVRQTLGIKGHAEVVTQAMMDDYQTLRTLPSNERAAALDTWLSTFGHRGPLESDPAQPRFAELRDVLLADLMQASNARAPASSSSQPRRWWTRPWFIVDARREWFRDQLMQRWQRLREKILAQGARLVAHNQLIEPGDVFMLTADDVDTDDDYRILVEQRGARRDVHRSLDTPLTLTQDALRASLDARQACSQEEGERPSFVKGISLTSKVMEGHVVVADDLSQLLRQVAAERVRLDHETILVVPALEPSWAVVFGRVGGVISEIGGELSHASILLREARRPAIINCHGILQHVNDGDHVRLNGPDERVEWIPDPSHTEHIIGDNFRQKLEIWSRNPATAQRQVE